MSIVSDADINTWMGTSSDTMVQSIRDEVETLVKKFCQRDFEETSYTEYHSGKGEKKIFLDQYPVSYITRLSIGRNNAIKVNNSSSSTYAAVTVTSTGVILDHDGTKNTLLFADYATMNLMVAAINAVGDGWSASLMSTDYSSYKSTELIEKFGLNCLDTDYAYLEIPDEPEDDFEIYPDEGIVYLPGGFPKGHRNVRVEYTAGYAAADMPLDLQRAVKIIVQAVYKGRPEGEDTSGLKKIKLGDLTMDFEANCPSQALVILERYQKRDIWIGGE